MRLPNKVFSFKESVISKFPAVLSILENRPMGVRELYVIMQNRTEDVGEFLEILDCLYALGKINYDEKAGTLNYVS